MKKTKPKYKNYELIEDTTGKITNGVFIRKDKRALKISFAWGDDLNFLPQEEINQ